jgi:hypothetical protein
MAGMIKKLVSIDDKGNALPDFSYVGYHHFEKPIPNLPAVKTMLPVKGNNRL